jgi:short-subunit dehydrogenase
MKWILVTGASTGIGRAAAEFLAEKGFGIYAGARKKEDLENLSKIENVVSVKLDVTRNDNIEQVYELIRERNTGLFGLVNNAGIGIIGPLMELSDTDITHQLDVNLVGVHRVTKAMFPFILESKGRIINISSINGLISMPYYGPYCTSKFALEGYSDALRRELMFHGIKVIVIQPGLTESSIWEKGADSIEKLKENLEGSIFLDRGVKFGEDLLKTVKTSAISATKIAEGVYTSLTIDNPKNRYLITENNFRNKIMLKMSSKKIDDKIKKNLERF